jgi:NTP pyrophosphatase (non-canonical NTP hydrolase)
MEDKIKHEIMGDDFLKERLKKFKLRAIERKRSLYPWKDFSTAHLLERLFEEFQELVEAADNENVDEIMDECLDVANYAWFIYEQAKMCKSEAQ